MDLLRGIPVGASLTSAHGDERRVLEGRLQAGHLYVGDSGYRDFALFEKIRTTGSSFVMRLQDNAVFETIEERALTEEDRAAGVVFDRVAWLGSAPRRDRLAAPVRLVKVHVFAPSRPIEAERI